MNHAAFAALAESMIAQNGRQITVTKSGSAPVVGGKPWQGVSNAAGSGSPGATSTVYGVFTEYAERQIDGTIIRRGDKKCLVAGTAAGLETYDAIKDGAATWQIVKTTTLEPGPTRLLYEFQVRQ